MKVKVVSLLVAIAMLVTMISIPVFAVTTPNFRIDGKVVLAGKVIAPEGNFFF